MPIRKTLKSMDIGTGKTRLVASTYATLAVGLCYNVLKAFINQHFAFPGPLNFQDPNGK